MSGDYGIETPIKTAHLKLIIFEYIINLECDYMNKYNIEEMKEYLIFNEGKESLHI